jgi:acyl-CoA reductase-like NAD-dependent aldehyde dehydrogenase
LIRDILLNIAAAMKEESETLAISEALTGKPIRDARADVDACIECFKFFAGEY